MALLLAAGAGWQWLRANDERTPAERNLTLAQRNESQALASLAENEVERGSPATVVRLALAALPMRLDSPDRAHARVAEGALLDSVQHLRERRRFSHESVVWSVAFSPDGRTLATDSEDKAARLWEVATGKEIPVLRGHEKWVNSVAFSPDGRTLATGSNDNTARLWPLEQRVIDLACARVRFLPLSEKDRQRFEITKEWCMPEVSAELRSKLRLDELETSSAFGTLAR